MRNAHEVRGCKLTPAICRSTYPDGKEVCRVAKVPKGKGADGYHVESPRGTTWYVCFWDTARTKGWTSQDLKGEVPSMHLKHSADSLKTLLEKLRSADRIRELEAQLGI